MAVDPAALHAIDKRVGGLEQWRKEYPELVKLQIKTAVDGVVLRIVVYIGALLAAQSLLERFLAGGP